MSQLKTPPAPLARTDSPGRLGPLAEVSVSIPWTTALAARVLDYIELTKPRISVMVLISVSVGFALASGPTVSMPLLGHALLGIALMAAGSSALNQFLERDSDRLMPRTADRPLPASRLLPFEVLAFGVAFGASGFVYLATAVNWLTAILTALTLTIYVAIYTPLKKKTSLCTAIGAIPGALPPVLGWTAAGGELNVSVLSLFAILFLWQFPHFLAIAWLYREQYAKADLRMLPSRRVGVTGWLATGYALALFPISLFPSQVGLAGNGYFLTALVLSAGYLMFAVHFLRNESRKTARRLLLSSLVYLPVLLVVLTWDHFRLLQ